MFLAANSVCSYPRARRQLLREKMRPPCSSVPRTCIVLEGRNPVQRPSRDVGHVPGAAREGILRVFERPCTVAVAHNAGMITGTRFLDSSAGREPLVTRASRERGTTSPAAAKPTAESSRIPP